MQKSKTSSVSKYFTKSKIDAGATEVNYSQTKRHNFLGKPIETNNGNMQVLDISGISGQGNTRSNYSNNRSSILLSSDQILTEGHGIT